MAKGATPKLDQLKAMRVAKASKPRAPAGRQPGEPNIGTPDEIKAALARFDAPAPAEDRAGWAKNNPKSVAALKKAGDLPGDGLPSKSQIRRLEVTRPKPAKLHSREDDRLVPIETITHPKAKKKTIVKELKAKVAATARPPAHPDCERCKYDAARTAARVRKWRKDKQGDTD